MVWRWAERARVARRPIGRRRDRPLNGPPGGGGAGSSDCAVAGRHSPKDRPRTTGQRKWVCNRSEDNFMRFSHRECSSRFVQGPRVEVNPGSSTMFRAHVRMGSTRSDDHGKPEVYPASGQIRKHTAEPHFAFFSSGKPGIRPQLSRSIVARNSRSEPPPSGP